MADTKISGYSALTSLASGDLSEWVDVSDPTMDAAGTNKKVTLANVAAAVFASAVGTDPDADRILFWDDSAGSYAYLTAGSGLSITGTTLTASGGGGGSGDVVGPASAVDGEVALFDGTTGKLLKATSTPVVTSLSVGNAGLIGTGGSVFVFAGSDQIFRGVVASAWADTQLATFFQVGTASALGVFQTAGGNKFGRLMFYSTGTQVGNRDYTTMPAPTAISEVQGTTPGTAAIVETRKVNLMSGGTPAAGFGARDRWTLHSSTTEDRDAAEVDVEWATATDGSRKAKVTHRVYDTAARTALVMESTGSEVQISTALANVRDAADDAAAAALSPAVPVGGIYRTGSQLKIRTA